MKCIFAYKTHLMQYFPIVFKVQLAFCILLTWIPLSDCFRSESENCKFQMYRFNAEDPGQSLYTPTTVGVITLSHGSKVTMYADDLVLYKVIDTDSALFCLQDDINNIVQWARSNLMTLNYSKCKIMQTPLFAAIIP